MASNSAPHHSLENAGSTDRLYSLEKAPGDWKHTCLKVVLIWPKGYDPAYALPLPLGYLKSNIDNQKHQVTIIDCVLDELNSTSQRLRQRILQHDPEVVGISSLSTMANETLEILNLVKTINSNIVTVVGGPHATCVPAKVLSFPQVDFVFRGEAELSFETFLENLEGKPNWALVEGLCYKDNGDLMITNTARIQDMDTVKIPDYDAMNIEDYIKIGYRLDSPVKRNAPILTTRGCPYQCTFCCAPIMNGNKIRKHSIPYLLEWVKYLYFEKRIKWINIIDDNFTFDFDYVFRFCNEVIKLGIDDLGFGTPNGIRLDRGNPQLWKLMKSAGWRTLVVAPESGSDRVLQIMKKDIKPALVPQVVKDIKAAGLQVKGFFIIGFPGETTEDIKKTSSLIKKCKFDFLALSNFQPLPGTPIYQELVKKGEIADDTLPANYFDGVRAYTPSELRDFNFSKFALKTFLVLALRDPRVALYALKHYKPGHLLKKLYLNLKSALKKSLQI